MSYYDPDGTSIFSGVSNFIKGAGKAISSAASSVGNWVSEKIVKPIKEVFAPKKESSSASVGQNTATSNKNSYSPPNYLTGGGANVGSSTGYNGISRQAREEYSQTIAENDIEKAQEKLSTLSKGFESSEQNSVISNPTGGEKTIDEIKKVNIEEGINIWNSIAGTVAGIGDQISRSGISKGIGTLTSLVGVAMVIFSEFKTFQNDKLNTKQKIASLAVDVASFVLSAGVSVMATTIASSLIAGIWAGNIVGTAGTATFAAGVTTGAIVIGIIAVKAAIDIYVSEETSHLKKRVIEDLR